LIEGISENEIERLKEIRDDEERTEVDIIAANKILAKIHTRSIGDYFRENSITDETSRNEFNYRNSWRIIRTVSVSGGAKTIADIEKKKNSGPYFAITTPDRKMYFILNHYDENAENPRIKILFADDYLTFNPGDFWQDIKTTGLGDEGGVVFTNGKKPIKLIKRLLQLTTNDHDIVLDFFAGSCSTGHASIEIDKEQNTKRKYILVQIPEVIIKNEFPNVAELGKERIRRIIKKVNDEKKIGHSASPLFEKEDVGLDLGFRVYKYSTSNFKQWKFVQEGSMETVNPHFDYFSDPLISGWKKEDLLSEILLLEGFPLTSKVTYLEDHLKNEVYCVSAPDFCAHDLFVCLDKSIQPATVELLTMAKEDIFVCLDSALSDELKARLQDKFNVHVI